MKVNKQPVVFVHWMNYALRFVALWLFWAQCNWHRVLPFAAWCRLTNMYVFHVKQILVVFAWHWYNTWLWLIKLVHCRLLL